MRCPTCKREFDKESSTAIPFCSERCRTIDLGRWLGEAFRLPVARQPEEDDSLEAEAEGRNGTNGEPS